MFYCSQVDWVNNRLCIWSTIKKKHSVDNIINLTWSIYATRKKVFHNISSLFSSSIDFKEEKKRCGIIGERLFQLKNEILRSSAL